MKKHAILLLLVLTNFGCADPTRLITNKPKFRAEAEEREQRRQEDKAATEALKNFKITDHAGKKRKQTIPKEESRPSSEDSQSKPAENAPRTPSTQPEKK